MTWAAQKQRAYNRKYFASEAGRAARARAKDRARIKGSTRSRAGSPVVSAWNARRNAETRALLHSIKRVPCADCGGVFDPVCMDFDHRPDEEKVFQISSFASSVPRDVLVAEIAKCDVVCANCHRLRTHRRRVERANVKTANAQALLPFGGKP